MQKLCLILLLGKVGGNPGAFLWQQRPIDYGIKCKLQSHIREAPVSGSRILACQAFDDVSLHRIREYHKFCLSLYI
jgi:hypothetical protein